MRKIMVTDNAGVQHILTVEPNQFGIEYVTEAPGLICPILPVPWVGARCIFAAERYMVEELEEPVVEEVVSTGDELMDHINSLLD